MSFVDLGYLALGLIALLFIIYLLIACHDTRVKDYRPLIGFGILVFGGILVTVLMMHGRLGITEKLYLQHLELKTECEFVIPRSDECVPVIQYVPEHGG